MNAKKTKTMVFSKSSNPPNTRIHIEGKLIEKVQTFTHLGALMTEDGRWKIRERNKKKNKHS